MDTVTKKITKTHCTGTSDHDRADALAQEWLVNGLPDEPTLLKTAQSITFCDFLKEFWDFDSSEYFKELQTAGHWYVPSFKI